MFKHIFFLIFFLQAFSGRDASQAFMSYHRRQFPHSRVKEAFTSVEQDVKISSKYNEDFLDLCERVDKVLKIMIVNANKAVLCP